MLVPDDWTSSKKTARCAICDVCLPAKHFMIREMFFGTREAFEYFECSNCGCIQIVEQPSDMARHYPESYYSLGNPKWIPPRLGAMKSLAKRARLDLHIFLHRNFPALRTPFGPDIKDVVLDRLIKKPVLRAGSRILDIGCGRGQRLLEWRYYGFSDLLGMDPFVPELDYGNGVMIYNKWESIEAQKVDFIMLNHSLEHIPDQLATLQRIHRCLRPDRFVVVRIPTRDSEAWSLYGTNWVQLDAPRHFFIHSVRSIEILASRAGFVLRKVEYDSTEFQFWASDQYARDVPLMDPSSYLNDKSALSKVELAEFRARADTLNAKGRGDQAIFYLQKTH